MKNKITQLYKDTQYYKEKHPFIYTFIIGVTSIILPSFILFLVLQTLSFILSFFPDMNMWELIMILTFSISFILLIGIGVSGILDELS